MSIEKSGISIGIERDNNNIFLKLKAVGKLTHEDYKYMVPMIEGTIIGIRDVEIDALIDIREFNGWGDIEAVWDDFKFGLDHRKEFKKIAMIGDSKWQSMMAKVISLFMEGEVKFFHNEESGMEWLRE